MTPSVSSHIDNPMSLLKKPVKHSTFEIVPTKTPVCKGSRALAYNSQCFP
jgi:hypothetical protein